ncbi:MAG: prepilin peptidase [candidate division Zixibacteria bacterium]|nr:prepilin peptidase [candidate division Zixibacteria bacterium]
MPFDWYVYGLVALFGLAIGSFLNVLIYRLPREKNTVLGRSACPHCGHTIPIHWNIPLVSYLILGGKCRWCRGSISRRYPAVEIITALLFMLFLYRDGLSVRLVVDWFLSAALIAIFFIDWDFQIIPDKITLPGIIIGLLAALVVQPPGIVDALIGMVVGGGTLLVVAYAGQWLFKKEAMGGGDIKMAAMMGAFVGWQKILLVFFGGALFGMAVSLVWMAVSPKVRRERVIPFGPFLAMAAIAVIIYGDTIIRYYIVNFLRV